MKFLNKPAIRFISRWEVQTVDPLHLVDDSGTEHKVPAGYISDLASIRSLREVCRWAAAAALLASAFPGPWAYWLLLVSVAALALYGLLAGYAMRPAIYHDWLYESGNVSRKHADDMFYQALRADGIARWRAAIFYAGVRAFGWTSYGADK